MNTVRERVESLVARRGAVPFSDVMRIALHDPDVGFYASRAPGAGAPFTSAPATSFVYASCLARAFESMWTRLGRPDRFVVREAGPGTADLAAGVLDAVGTSPFGVALAWQLVEPHAAMRDVQAERLRGRRVEWLTSLQEGPPLDVGCVVANEVLDTLPVDLVRTDADGTAHLARVTATTGGHGIVYDGQVPSDVAGYIDRYAGSTKDEQIVEVGLEAVAWMRSAARSVIRGYVLVIDYGDLAPDLYDHRAHGSLLVYHEGGITDDPLAFLGEADVTAHVNFSALIDAAAADGMDVPLLALQRDVLLACGIREDLDTLARAAADAPAQEALQLQAARMAAAELVRRGGFGGFRMLLGARRAGVPSILKDVPDLRNVDTSSRWFPVPPEVRR